MSAEKTPRYRRTKASIEAAIKKAAESQITEHGFANLLVTEIMKAAAIEPPVFYHRYKNLDEFYSVFVKEYDYWFSDLADKAMKNNSDPKAQFIALMRGLLGGGKRKIRDAGDTALGGGRGKRHHKAHRHAPRDVHPATG